MAVKIKSFELGQNEQVVSKQDVYFEFVWRTHIGLEWNIKDNNWTSRGGAGSGDRGLSQDSVKVDGNLIFCAGYSDGVGIRRLNDDGTFTVVYNNSTPMNGYAYYPSCAVDPVRKHFYFGNWVYDNIGRIDYSDTSSLSVEVLTEAGNGLPSDEVGYTYHSGLEVVGDYLYICPDDKGTTTVFRWHIPSETAENLTVKNQINSHRYGHCWYDAEHDRLYYVSRADAMLRVVVNPSATASYAEADPSEVTASAFQVRTDSIMGGNDTYTHLWVPDNDDPNIMIISTNYGRFCKVDISACIEGTTNVPTLLEAGTRYNTDARWRTVLLFIEGIHAKKHPVYGSDMPIVRNYATWTGRNFGWIDVENQNWVGVGPINAYGYRKKGTTTTQPTTGPNALNFTYTWCPHPYHKVQASEGTEYWVLGGYDGDGSAFISYDINNFPNFLELVSQGNIVFGDFQLEDETNISSIQINKIANMVFEPGDDTYFKVFVSNDGGNHYQAYDWRKEGIRRFNTRGNTVRVKFVLQGSGKRGPYLLSLKRIVVVIRGFDKEEKETQKNVVVKKIVGV